MNENLNSANKFKNKIILIIVSVTILLLIIVALKFIILNKEKTPKVDDNYNYEYSDILDHLTIKDIKLKEFITINDYLNKLNLKIFGITVCYKKTETEQGCPYYPKDKFFSDNVSKEGISTLTFALSFDNDNIDFQLSTNYNEYKKNKNNSKFFSQEIFNVEKTIKLDGNYLDENSVETLKEKYNIDIKQVNNPFSSDEEVITSIDTKFKDKNNYSYSMTGSLGNSSRLEIFNNSERDRQLEKEM